MARVFQGAVLREARRHAGLSQATLERLIAESDPRAVPGRAATPSTGTPRFVWGRRVASWESGHYQPRAADVPRLAQILEVDPLDLLAGGREHPTPATLRIAAGMSLEQLAERARVAYGSCQRIDSGVVTPTQDVAAKLAAIVGVSVEDYIAAARRAR